MRFVALNILRTKEAYKITQPIFSHRVEHELVSTVVENIVCKSNNEGKTGDIYVYLDPEDIEGGFRDPILELPDSSLLMSDISLVLQEDLK